MKYESSILKRLVETYGVVGNPRYISEVIKEFIVRGKESFPNLFTYQSDWLAHIDGFGLKPSYTVSYTGQSIYAPNTLEKPFKSAILKGSTKYRDIETGDILDTFDETKNLELVSVKMPVLTTTGKNLFDMNHASYINGLIHVSNQTINQTSITKAYYIPCEPNTSYTISKMMTQYFRICETSVVPTFGCAISNPVNNPSKASLTITTSESAKYLCFNVHNVNADTMDESEVVGTVQIEKGLVATSYEPYKSNILTVNEDVTLREVDDVQDTLDLVTGELTQRIGEFVVNGTENWKFFTILSDTSAMFSLGGAFNSLTRYPEGFITDSAYPKRDIFGSERDFEGIELSTNNPRTIYMKVKKSSLNGWDETLSPVQKADLFKSLLSQNPITFQYQLATPTVKTVALTIKDHNGQSVDHLKSFNGGTHVYTSSLDGSLVPSVDISVETDLEETLKMCSLDGNTM